MNEIFAHLSVILLTTTVLSILARISKQPLIIAYILTGLILSSYFSNINASLEVLKVFSQIGVALLLFIVGLNLSPKVLKDVGKLAIISGIAQIGFTFIIAYILSSILGFKIFEAFIIGMSLTFSSTIIVLKSLSDKKELTSLQGKITTGILLVQDLTAMVVLLFLPGFLSASSIDLIFIRTISVGLITAGGIILFSIWLLPKLTNFFAKSQELLFLFSIAYGIGLASLFSYLGFSIEIGSLLAGVTLTFFPFHYEIASKMRPIRDFFVILFFISLGTSVQFTGLGNELIYSFIFITFVVVLKPLIVTVLMNLIGYRQRLGFITGLNLSQISEFSLIISAICLEAGMLSKQVAAILTIIGLATIATSSYFISHSSRIYVLFSGLLKFIRFRPRLYIKSRQNKYDSILFGYNRIGYDILKSFKRINLLSVVVDYDPEVIKKLNIQKINNIYGDVYDVEFLTELNFKNLKLIVSTIPDFNANAMLIKYTKEQNKKCVIIVMSHSIDDAKMLYKYGASYVVMPHFLGGEYASMMIKNYKDNSSKYFKEKSRHLIELDKRLKMGQEHPRVDKNYTF